MMTYHVIGVYLCTMKSHNAALNHDDIQAALHGSHRGQLVHEGLHVDALPACATDDHLVQYNSVDTILPAWQPPWAPHA